MDSTSTVQASQNRDDIAHAVMTSENTFGDVETHVDETNVADEVIGEFDRQYDKIATIGLANAVMMMIHESDVEVQVVMSEIERQAEEVFGYKGKQLTPASQPAATAPSPVPFKGLAAPRVLTQDEIAASVTDATITSFENGQSYKTLTRHLSSNGLSPDEYIKKWGLPSDYPMVSPAYSRARSGLAKELGLGRKKGSSPTQAELKTQADADLAVKTDYTLNGVQLPQGVVDALSTSAKRKKQITEGQIIAGTVSDDTIISLLDGKSYKTLPRHLSANGMSQDAYREIYGLSDKYPMSANNFRAGPRPKK